MVIQDIAGGYGWRAGDDSAQTQCSVTMWLSDGTNHLIRTCGNNDYGQLGDGTTVQKTNPLTALTGSLANPIQQIASLGAGVTSNYVLYTNGDLRVWGHNSTIGNLGVGDTNNRLTASLSTTGVDEILLGNTCYYRLPQYTGAYIKKTDGNYYATGYNFEGQLGTRGTLTLSGANTWTKMLFPVGTNLKFMARLNGHPNAYSVAAVTDDNRIYGWGYTATGALVSGTEPAGGVLGTPVLIGVPVFNR
jgi:alpha-tubulin suppressor-like RCC1 family protein